MKFLAENKFATLDKAPDSFSNFTEHCGCDHSEDKKKKSKVKFIALSNSYHGETLGSLSVSNIDLYKKTYKSILKETIIVDSPDSYNKAEGVSEEKHAEIMFDKMYDSQ